MPDLLPLGGGGGGGGSNGKDWLLLHFPVVQALGSLKLLVAYALASAGVLRLVLAQAATSLLRLCLACCVLSSKFGELGPQPGPHEVGVGSLGGKLGSIPKFDLIRLRFLSFGRGLVQPPLDVGIPPFAQCSGCFGLLVSNLCDGFNCVGACMCCPETCWFSFVCWASVPWQATVALPKTNKPLSLALVAPNPHIQLVCVKRCFHTWESVWALWAPKVNDTRGRWGGR